MTDTPTSTNPETQAASVDSETRMQQGTEPSPIIINGKDDMYDVGVLFIHGIGQQARGDTLVHSGEALINWLQKWIAGTEDMSTLPAADKSPLVNSNTNSSTDTSKVEVFDTELNDAASPPHSSVHLTLALPDRTSHQTSWLMAESWWAESFATARFQDLAYWGFTIVPWVLASYFGVQMGRIWGRVNQKWIMLGKWWFRLVKPEKNVVTLILTVILQSVGFIVLLLLVMASILAYSLLSAFLAVVFLILTILLLVLMLIPISIVRSAAMRLQQTLAAFLGDSYVLITSPIQAASIIGKVRRDLNWMAERCKSIAIVAHSQGAVVVHEVLRLSKPENLIQESVNISASNKFRGKDILLITFGSGLNLLESLRTAMTSANKRLGWQGVGGFGVILLVALLVVLGIIEIRGFSWGIAFLLFGVSNLVKGIATRLNIKRRSQDFAPQNRFGLKLKWLDFYSSLDPVPNGPLFDDAQASDDDEVKTIEVHNQAAFWSDHTNYWQNNEEFLSVVARAICRMTKIPLDHLRPLDPERLELAAYRRRWRVGWLGTARMLAILFSLILPITLWREMEIIGITVREGMSKLNIELLSPLVAPLLQVGDLVGKQALGGLSLVTAVVIGDQIMYWTWRWWDRADTKHYFERSDYTLGLPFLLFVLEGVVLFDIAVVVGLKGLPLLWKLGPNAAVIFFSPFIPFFVWWEFRYILGLLLSMLWAFLAVFLGKGIRDKARKTVNAAVHDFFSGFMVNALRGLVATLLAFPFLSWILVTIPTANNTSLMPSQGVVSPGSILDSLLANLLQNTGRASNADTHISIIIAIVIVLVWLLQKSVVIWLEKKGGVGDVSTALQHVASKQSKEEVN